MVLLTAELQFDWDQANIQKILIKHKVKTEEAEETFTNFNIIQVDKKHLSQEVRFKMIGINSGREGTYTYIYCSSKVNSCYLSSERK